MLCQSHPIDSDVLGKARLTFSSGIQYLLAVSSTSIPPNTTKANVVPKLAFVVLIIIIGHSSAKPQGNLGKEDFFTWRCWKIHSKPEGQTVRAQVEREREKEHGRGVASIRV